MAKSDSTDRTRPIPLDSHHNIHRRDRRNRVIDLILEWSLIGVFAAGIGMILSWWAS